MFGDRRRLVMSGGAVAVLVLAICALRPSAPAAAASTSAAQSRDGGQAARTPPPVAPVKLDTLTADREPPGQTNRNPFRYEAKAAPPSTTKQAAPPPVEATEAPKPVMPIGPPPTPPIPLKFIGVLERANGVKWAVLSDGKVPMHGREGDIVDGRYRIVKIGTESIEMTHIDGRGRQVIRLTGQ